MNLAEIERLILQSRRAITRAEPLNRASIDLALQTLRSGELAQRTQLMQDQLLGLLQGGLHSDASVTALRIPDLHIEVAFQYEGRVGVRTRINDGSEFMGYSDEVNEFLNRCPAQIPQLNPANLGTYVIFEPARIGQPGALFVRYEIGLDAAGRPSRCEEIFVRIEHATPLHRVHELLELFLQTPLQRTSLSNLQNGILSELDGLVIGRSELQHENPNTKMFGQGVLAYHQLTATTSLGKWFHQHIQFGLSTKSTTFWPHPPEWLTALHLAKAMHATGIQPLEFFKLNGLAIADEAARSLQWLRTGQGDLPSDVRTAVEILRNVTEYYHILPLRQHRESQRSQIIEQFTRIQHSSLNISQLHENQQSKTSSSRVLRELLQYVPRGSLGNDALRHTIDVLMPSSEGDFEEILETQAFNLEAVDALRARIRRFQVEAKRKQLVEEIRIGRSTHSLEIKQLQSLNSEVEKLETDQKNISIALLQHENFDAISKLLAEMSHCRTIREIGGKSVEIIERLQVFNRVKTPENLIHEVQELMIDRSPRQAIEKSWLHRLRRPKSEPEEPWNDLERCFKIRTITLTAYNNEKKKIMQYSSEDIQGFRVKQSSILTELKRLESKRNEVKTTIESLRQKIRTFEYELNRLEIEFD